jgi:hypothetical protein
MSSGQQADELAAKATEAIRDIVAEAEQRAAEIVRDAEANAASIRERAEAEAAQIRDRGEADARAQIESAKRALDELGGTLVAAATEAIPGSAPEPEPVATESEESQPEEEPQPDEQPEAPSESPGAPEAPISPPPEESPTVESEPAPENGDGAAERLVAMKLAVEGKDPAAIEAELIQKFGPGDRSDLLRDVVDRAAR